MYRSILFAPAIRPARVQKALRSNADAVCVDLEDAVPPARKAEARACIGTLSVPPGVCAKQCLRVNALTTLDGILDLAMLASAKFKPEILILPKVSAPVELTIAQASVGRHIGIIPLVETTEGLNAAEAIAAHPAARALIFGSADFSAEVGSSTSWEALLYARSKIIVAAKAAGKCALDGVWPDFHDEDGLIEDTRRLKHLGFDGRLAIHPRQITGIHAGLAPIASDLAAAREIVVAFEAGGGNAIQVNGEMVDRPIYEAAVAIIRRSQIQ